MLRNMFRKKEIKGSKEDVNSVKFIKSYLKEKGMNEQLRIFEGCHYIEDILLCVFNYGSYEQNVSNNKIKQYCVNGILGYMIFIKGKPNIIDHIGIIIHTNEDGEIIYRYVNRFGKVLERTIMYSSTNIALLSNPHKMNTKNYKGYKGYIICNSRVLIQEDISVFSKNTYLPIGTIKPFYKIYNEDGYISVLFALFKDATGFVEMNEDITIVNVNKRNEVSIPHDKPNKECRYVKVVNETDFYVSIEQSKRNDIYPVIKSGESVQILKGDITWLQVNNHIICNYKGVSGFISIKDLQL